MISLMHECPRSFYLSVVKSSFFVSVLLTLLLFSLVVAQDDEASFPSDETSFPTEETSVPTDETSGSGGEYSGSTESSGSTEEYSGSSDESSESEETTPPKEDIPNPLVEPPPATNYTNFAQKGSYENENWFSEVPQWHYYDMFGNKIIDGFYLYGLSKNGNNVGTGQSNLALHPFIRMWFSGLVQIADLHENGGIMAMIGDRVKSEFTPYTLKQTLFGGSRFDLFYNMTSAPLQLSMSFLTNRISNTGAFGLVINQSTAQPSADWITGAHPKIKFGEFAGLGGTYVNLHHEESKSSSNPMAGVDFDTLTMGTMNGLSLWGLDLNLNLAKLQAYGEFLTSQEFYDGKFKPKAGMVATLNGQFDALDKWRLGTEMYSVGSRFQTNFTCPAHPYGDATEIEPGVVATEVGKYQYSLIEDNDDGDEFPENGRSKYLNFTQKAFQGDPDGSIPFNFDKDRNGIWDYDEAFLSYDADPFESQILFDRNNNGTPDEVEDDAYPDYTYVPSYYLPGERYYRYDDIDTIWKNKFADSITHKGLAGYHLYTRFAVLENLEFTLGGIFDQSQEKTFQPKYENGIRIGEVYEMEKASNIYFLTHFKGVVGRDFHVTVDNFFRMIKDNIPNHTQGFYIDPNTEEVIYNTIVDELDYRDMFANAIRAEFSLHKNRGLSYTGVGKFEFQKHNPHLEFNYRAVTTTALTLVNKAHYTILLPIFKDMFLIPKLKNIWEMNGYGPRPDSLDPAFNPSFDHRFRRNAMTTAAHLVLEWKLTEKTSLTNGGQIKFFNDLINGNENYISPCYRVQLMMKDRYAGMVLVLTTGFSVFRYAYSDSGMHNPLNNPHRAMSNISSHEFFIKIHSGF